MYCGCEQTYIAQERLINVETTLGVPTGPAPEDANGANDGKAPKVDEDGHFLTPFLSSIGLPDKIPGV